MKGTQTVPGETTGTLVFNNVQTSDAGDYTCSTIDSALGAKSSTAQSLSVASK